MPITTIKYYLREGLLPAGRPTAPNQAAYDESHVRRLRLIRALVGVRGLSVGAAKDVLSGVYAHEGDVHQVLGIVLGATTQAADGDGDGNQDQEQCKRLAEVDALLDSLGWEVSDDAPGKAVIARTLDTLSGLGMAYDWHQLVPYAELAGQIATVDLDKIEDLADPLEMAERALVLTVLLEPVLMALRRLAQEHQSAARRGVSPASAP
ncbi:MerR family transcriptional regulator [Streptomyces sp. H34-S4]|uniref:MerR family transcriptional regulator n=1 Tax=Streptomyces sp. H34-S4 TaxID=2996463 RepID=UPI002D1E41B4|nr:MerR family transcriptional regulator [Streptomyces sp. H34-S4]